MTALTPPTRSTFRRDHDERPVMGVTWITKPPVSAARLADLRAAHAAALAAYMEAPSFSREERVAAAALSEATAALTAAL